MVGIDVAPDPGLTRHLVTATAVFRDDPVVIVDLGSRGGFNAEWKAFSSGVRIYGFEPDKAECARLNAAAKPGVTYLPWAIGARSGEATLYETRLNASTGLYATNMDYFGRLLNRENGVVVAEHRIVVRTLADALAEIGIGQVDFIKLDVEGAELDILRGSAAYLEAAAPLGLLSEIRFQPEINGSPVFAELDAFLRPLGLRLYDLEYTRQSRVALPYPSVADYRLPTGERFFAYTKHGQIQDGNALYFRDLLIPANADALARMSPVRVLKLAAFYEIYSLADCAAELIEATRDRLEPLVDCGRLLDLLASGVNGRATRYADYVASYFTPSAAARSVSPAVVASLTKVARLRAMLARVRRLLRGGVTRPLCALKRLFADPCTTDDRN